ncbi:glycosyltransferase family A protein [Rhizobium lusitanum]|uniref:Glycosyltransferase involved in cell wall biosynthesis n=1 Tax=Rhizobium lusitanum TaxID=293958 RepID=A0A7X0IRL4_9HYPH|nr:glycosyltransferase family A protein [Rhizobium lusitanum]MBB6485564.1 glycosyltransferase involved in cell wall biosynthesis [Rhizobium lusitanum]
MAAYEQSIPALEGGPKVSVIIPTYNRARFIGAALESVLAQTFTDFELVLVDDGSTDETPEVVARYLDDPRVLYIKQNNRGRSQARNRALAVARGAYIAFLDSDDSYLPEKLAKQVAYLDSKSDVDMIYTSATCVDEAGKPLAVQAYNAREEGDIYNLIAFFQPLTITLPTVMVRRAVMDRVGGFDINMERFEDTDLWRRIAKSHRVGAMPEVTCLLTTHDDNSLASQNPGKILRAIDYYITKVFRDDADRGMPSLRQGASRLCEYYGRALLLAADHRGKGLSLLTRAISYAPGRSPGIALRAIRTLVGAVLRGRIGSKGLEQ